LRKVSFCDQSQSKNNRELPMLIRSAQVNDIKNLFPSIQRVCDFHQSLDLDRYNFLPNQGKLYEKWLQKLLQDSRHLCLVAEAEVPTQLVAYTIATVESEIPIYHLKEYGYIHDLWVEEPYRHRGIAKQMVMQTVSHFQQLGIKQIRLNNLVSNDVAFKLYTACGFRASTVEMLYTFN